MQNDYKEICKDLVKLLKPSEYFGTPHKFNNLFYDPKKLSHLSSAEVDTLYKDIIISWTIITTRNLDPNINLSKIDKIKGIRQLLTPEMYKILYNWIIGYLKAPKSYKYKGQWTQKVINNFLKY
jgi:hypothetical protein